ncbi:MAG: hypothetical protein ACRDHM_09520 [Actinomycetota bacterium]
MRRLILVLPLALLVMAPTAVRAAAGDLVVCDAPPEGTTVIGPNHSSTPSFATPQGFFPSREYTDLTFQLDLYPATATNKATLSSTLNWTVDVNDWDLFLLDANGEEIGASEGFQIGPAGDPPTESVSSSFLHCSLFTIRVLNFQAVPLDDIDPLQLGVTTGSVK